jgi:hypothetical protein
MNVDGHDSGGAYSANGSGAGGVTPEALAPGGLREDRPANQPESPGSEFRSRHPRFGQPSIHSNRLGRTVAATFGRGGPHYRELRELFHVAN